MVAGGDSRKNVEGLLRAWAALPGPVLSAKLRLWCSTDPSVAGGSVRRLPDTTWSETAVTWNSAPVADPTDPFAESVAGFTGIGVDAKYGVTSGLTLDATVNPDFSQVEADADALREHGDVVERVLGRRVDEQALGDRQGRGRLVDAIGERLAHERRDALIHGALRADLRDLDLQMWRAGVAAVFQDFARFEWTLRENILLGQPQDDARLHAAVQGSGLNTVLTGTRTLDTRLGQAFGGADLSGGQWQKLATARALYRDARVLILDEPTAALDPRSEAEVFDTFAALARGRTTLLVTHRLGSVLMADRVLVMKAGQIIEDGTHAALLARGGEYADLWALQARQYEDQPEPILA